MAMETLNPANGELVATFDYWDERKIDAVLDQVKQASESWQSISLPDRAKFLLAAAKELRKNKREYADLITLEMGKPTTEAKGEIEKCAAVCDYYAENGATFLADEIIESDAGKSMVAHIPVGTVLAVMPWNYPFWQVLRFAAPSLMAGNTCLLKHASNVPQCAQAIEKIGRAHV